MTAHIKRSDFTTRTTGKGPALAALPVTEVEVERLLREAGERFEAQRDAPRHHLVPGLLDPVCPSQGQGLFDWTALRLRLLRTALRKQEGPAPARH